VWIYIHATYGKPLSVNIDAVFHIKRVSSYKMSHAVVLLAYIREVPGSNLGR
jgi:hypothetical protein